MKQTNTFIVFRNKKGHYLSEYKNNDHALAYSCGWSDEIEDALRVSEANYNGKDNERYLAMAMMFNAEPIKAQAEYTLTTLDGQEPAEPVESEEYSLDELLTKIFGDRKD